MNTRTFPIKLISAEKMSQYKARLDELKLQVSEDKQEKFTCWTHRENKRPQFKYYEYKS